ncbi:protein PML-like [Watersipora subatra]|uniref:protein PML-like n=1 Tax=Watersipora subatra TaxID=2589382 RepID=UPI00355AD81B
MAEGRETLIKKLREHLICPICTEEAELRMLPCQHSMCVSCIERVVSPSSQDGRDAHCPYCYSVLSRSLSDYPKALLANSLREQLDQLEVAIKEEKLTEGPICKLAGCQRPVDWQCTACKEFICQRCSKKKQCPISHSLHELADFQDLKKKCEERFKKWKVEKKTEIDSLKQKTPFLLSLNTSSNIASIYSEKRVGAKTQLCLTPFDTENISES